MVLPNLIYYSSITTRSSSQVIAQYLKGDDKLPIIASQCLECIPPLHTTFSYTTNGRAFACIIDESFRFCSISDEALPRSMIMSFLQQLRHEFYMHSRAHGLSVDDMLRNAWPRRLTRELNAIFRPLAAPFVGIPQKKRQDLQASYARGDDFDTAFPSMASPPYDVRKEEGVRTPFTPLLGKTRSNKNKQKKLKDEARDINDNQNRSIDKDLTLDISSDAGSSGTQLQKAASMRSKGQPQVTRRAWWKNVKLILALDAVVCLILFGIWLGVCKGFSCVHSSHS